MGDTDGGEFTRVGIGLGLGLGSGSTSSSSQAPIDSSNIGFQGTQKTYRLLNPCIKITEIIVGEAINKLRFNKGRNPKWMDTMSHVCCP